MSENAQKGSFPQTRWSIVLNAQEENPEALSHLCKAYWIPLFSYARRLRPKIEDAEDLTQAFFEHLLSKKGILKAAPERGKLRSFLLRSLQNFSTQDWKQSQRQKRGGGTIQVMLDGLEPSQKQACEPREDLTPEIQFDRVWASQLLDQVMNELRKTYTQSGKSELFEALSGQIMLGGDLKPYLQIANELGVSEASIRFSSFKLRTRYRLLLREYIAETVGSPEEAEEELRHLRLILEK